MDIDPTTIPDAPVITGLKGLTDTVHDLAQVTLTVREAEAKMAKAIEIAKADCEQATAPYKAMINRLFAGIANYATTAIDSLFPRKKDGTRKKTFAILNHKLQLRSSSSITAPEDIIAKIRLWYQLRMAEADASLCRGDSPTVAAQIEAEALLIASLIRRGSRRVPESQPNQDLQDGATQAYAAPQIRRDDPHTLGVAPRARQGGWVADIGKILGAYEKDNEQKKPELTEALAQFVGQLHGEGAGRLQFTPRAPAAVKVQH